MKRQNGDDKEDIERILLVRLQSAEMLLDLIRSEKEAIRSEKWQELQSILDEKDQIIRRFDETGSGLDNRILPGNGMDPFSSIHTILSKIESTIMAAQAIETECMRSVADRRKQTGSTLKAIRKSLDEIGRFRTGGPKIARFVDLRK